MNVLPIELSTSTAIERLNGICRLRIHFIIANQTDALRKVERLNQRKNPNKQLHTALAHERLMSFGANFSLPVRPVHFL